MATARGLRRVVAMYAVMERLRLGEVSLASAEVDEVEQVSAAEELLLRRERVAGRVALADGNGAGRMVSSLSCEVAAVRVGRLAGLREERVEVLEEVTELHRESKLRLEQVEQVLEREQSAARMLAGRRLQGEADDRYGARLAWMRDHT